MTDYFYNKNAIVEFTIFTGIIDNLASKYTFEAPFGRLMVGCLIGLVKGFICDFILENIPVNLYPIIPMFLGTVSTVRLCRFVKSLFR